MRRNANSVTERGRKALVSASAAIVFLALSTSTSAESDGDLLSQSYLNVIDACIAQATMKIDPTEFEQIMDQQGFSQIVSSDIKLVAEAIGFDLDAVLLRSLNDLGRLDEILESDLLVLARTGYADDIENRLAAFEGNDGLFAGLKAYPAYRSDLGASVYAGGLGMFDQTCRIGLPLDDTVIEKFELADKQTTGDASYYEEQTGSFLRRGADIGFLWFRPDVAEAKNMMPLQIHVKQDS